MSILLSVIRQSPKSLPLKVSSLVLTRNMSSETKYKFETLEVTQPREFVTQVKLNRPDKLNSMNKAFWAELPECFNELSLDEDCRAIVICAAGRVFTAGLDLMDAVSNFGLGAGTDDDIARRAMKLKPVIDSYQETFTAIEKCRKPVIAAVHNACIGGGVDLITACDIRYCTADAWIQVKEVDIGLAADVGTLQRLPKVLGNDSLARELCYTARKMFSDEGLSCGLFSRVFQSKENLLEAALDTASLIASKSPVAVQGTKASMVYSRDHSVPEGLAHVALWNQAMLQSEDVVKAAMSFMEKKTPTFSKL